MIMTTYAYSCLIHIKAPPDLSNDPPPEGKYEQIQTVATLRRASIHLFHICKSGGFR